MTNGAEPMCVGKKRGAGALERAAAVCPLCEGGGLMERHCKLVCERCGYVESCEDNFAPMQTAPDNPVPNL